MITLHFHVQPQYKYEFHIYFTLMLIISKFTSLLSMNIVPLIPITLTIEKSFQFAPRFCFPYFLRENTIEQRDSYENFCEDNCLRGNTTVSSFFRPVSKYRCKLSSSQKVEIY